MDNTRLLEIRGNVESLVVGTDTDIENIKQTTGFLELGSIASAIESAAKTAISAIERFVPFHENISKQLGELTSEYTRDAKKAQNKASTHSTLKSNLETAKTNLQDFKKEHQLSDSDIDSTLWGAGAVYMMTFITLAEMLVSFSPLGDYSDKDIIIIVVNGGLSIVSSCLAMLAGQLLKISLRIKKEIHEYNNSEATAGKRLPKWIQEHPSVYANKGKYSYKGGFQNLLVFILMIFCAGSTVVKFLEPLQEGNTTAWIVTIGVILFNLIGFIAYEYLTYSGLNYPMRLKTDKLLRKVNKLEKQLEKGGADSVEDVDRKYNASKLDLKTQYDVQYGKVRPHIEELETCIKNAGICREIITAFEGKTEMEFPILKGQLELPTCRNITYLF